MVARGTIYLLHFEPAYKHASHYLGWTEDIDARIDRHQRGQGSPLVAAAVAAGCAINLARTWEGDRKLERKLKNRKNTPRQLCPICRGKVND
jgi:predicted GIY-YIG superfamily endonuclease